MDPSAQPDSDDLNGSLKRIHHLGTTTSQLFSRLYKGLNRRSRLQDEIDQQRTANWKLRRKLQEREQEVEWLQAVFASIDEGIILQDMQGRIVLMNNAAYDLLGNEKNFWQSQIKNLFNEYRRIQKVESELVPLGRTRKLEVNGRVLGAHLAAVADSMGIRFGTLIILRDITRDMLAQRLKDGIITGISHELKTPLASMRVASEILLNTPDDQPPNRRMLEMIGRNIDILNRMVIELLDVSEMSGGTFAVHRDPTDLEMLVWDVIHSFEPDLHKAKLDATIMIRDAERMTIPGDAARLKWALGHLIRNAIAYTQPDGRITLRVYPVNGSAPPRIAIAVQDTGVGISETDLPHIFNLFYRGEARTETGTRIDPRGLGQGLFIARQVAEAHDGALTVQSTLYRGSTFTLHLPAEAPVLPEDTPT